MSSLKKETKNTNNDELRKTKEGRNLSIRVSPSHLASRGVMMMSCSLGSHPCHPSLLRMFGLSAISTYR
jgi:hypothetical protein